MIYFPGELVRVPFTVPDPSGANTPGMNWSLSLLLRDGVPVTEGEEFDSVSVAAIGGNAYELRFTPAADSMATYLVTVLSDGDPIEVFEEIFEPDRAWLFLSGMMVRERGVSPETVEVKGPDGTVLKKFRYRREGTQEIREEV